MKNMDKFIREFENMSKEDLVKAVRQYCPNLDSSILWKMDLKTLATLVACSIFIEEIDKSKERVRKLIRYYRSELNSEQEQIESEILANLMNLMMKYQNLFGDAMQEYFKAQNDEEFENEKRIQEILEKHRKHMTEELEKQIRKERDEKAKQAKKQREAQEKGIQCFDDEERCL